MANDVFTELKSLFNIEDNRIYTVPVFQREYSWRPFESEQLFDDIFENNEGYFIGSVLLVKDTENTIGDPYNVIDGQQRITTISLLLNAIFCKVNQLDKDSEVLGDIKRKIVKRIDKEYTPRVNLLKKDAADYIEVVKKSGVHDFNKDTPKNWGNRKIARIWKSFQNKLEIFKTIEEVEEFYHKLNSCNYVQMIPDNTSDAYVLFEALNNRGMPLSIIDILKIDYFKGIDESQAIEEWTDLLKILGEDINIQTRFILALYSSIIYNYRSKLSEKEINFSMITKKKAIQNYKVLFENIDDIREVMYKKAKIYAEISGTLDSKNSQVSQLAKNLYALDATQVYPLLLSILDIPDIPDEFIIDVFESFIKFFVRRNITNQPQAKTVRLYTENCIKKISDIDSKNEESIRKILTEEMFSKAATDTQFKEELNKDVYTISSATTRRILIDIEKNKQVRKTKEYIELDKKTDNNQWYWTIEHILPQGDNIKDCWIEELLNISTNEISEKKREEAFEIKESNTHKLGNLTLTVYNSDMQDNCFSEKKKVYENQLWLNVEEENGLLIKDSWTNQEIDERTARLIKVAIEVFNLENFSK